MKQPISDNTYFSIQAWMVTKLKLKGAERDVYAIIYGYSQDNDSDFHGSLNYISQLTGYSRNAICTALKSLTDRGLITKTEKIVNNIKCCRYRTSSLYTVQVACTENEKSVQVACINNNSNTNNKKDNKTILPKGNMVAEAGTEFVFGVKKHSSKTTKLSLWDKCVSEIDGFTDDKEVRTLLIRVLGMFIDNSRESGVPFYSNHFKGKLNTLKKLAGNDIQLQKKIIQNTLDTGYQNFYPIDKTDTKGKSVATDIGVMSEPAQKKGGGKVGKIY